MNYQLASTTIKTRMKAQATVPAEYPNIPFIPPNNEPYLSMRIDFINREADEIGGSARVDGAVIVEVRTPENSSTEVHDALCASTNLIFSDVDVGPLRFLAGRVQTLGVMNGRYKSKIVVPFFFLED